MSDIILNEDELDCLQELINIAYGSATAAITEILNAHSTLSIPKIKVIKAKNLKTYLNCEISSEFSYFISAQQFNGDISGENLFVVDKNSAKNISLQFGLEEDEINDNELSDIVLEITNILSSSTMSKFSEDLNIPISFSPPSIDLFESLLQFNNDLTSNYEKVIIISTNLNFKEQNIKGTLLILTTDKSIILIKEILNKILDEL
ncbi:MAG: chemotaxis protein CheX [Campylobacteraceae bacterium]|nr:chemotaxis protein CheX [Campylobacteraceae bacterium]